MLRSAVVTTATRAIFAISAVLLLAGLWLGLSTLTAGPNTFDPMSCGSAFFADNEAADFEDNVDEIVFGYDDGSNVSACDEARDARKIPAYGALGLGVLALIGGLSASSREQTRV